jgi:hypothetical protein
MPRPQIRPTPLDLPPDLNLDVLPRWCTALQLSMICTYYFGPIAPRTIREAWALQWHEFNGRWISDTRECVAEARRQFKAAAIAGEKPERAGVAP